LISFDGQIREMSSAPTHQHIEPQLPTSTVRRVRSASRRAAFPSLAELRLPRLEHEVDSSTCAAIDQRTEALARKLEVIGQAAGAMPAEKYRRGRFGLLAALAYPDAGLDNLVLCNDFNTYLFYVDDQAEEDENYGKRPELLEAYFQGHAHTMRTGEAPCAEDPGSRLLLSIRRRLARRASESWVRRFADELETYLLRGTLVGARHWTAGSVPLLADYVASRAWDSAVFCSQDLAEVVCGEELPATLREAELYVESRRLVTQVVAFTNDLVSYPKEVQRHQSPNNLVHVLMTHEDLDLGAALWRAVDMINDDLSAYDAAVAGLDREHPEANRALAPLRASQRAWMVGNLVWSRQSGRYLDPESPFVELRSSH
jgi:hypothetical protein